MINEKQKICNKCKRKRPATLVFFGPDKRNKCGLQGICRMCKVASDKTSYIKHRPVRLKWQQQYSHSEKGRSVRIAYRKSIRGHLIQVFHNIKARIEDPNVKGFKNYGGRGIKCLFKSSKDFVDYAVTELKADPRGLEIDRINNNGDYAPGNIRFITCYENNLNRRNNRHEYKR